MVIAILQTPKLRWEKKEVPAARTSAYPRLGPSPGSHPRGGTGIPERPHPVKQKLPMAPAQGLPRTENEYVLLMLSFLSQNRKIR